MNPQVTALVVDDEPLARRKLVALLADVPWARCVGEADDGIVALDKIQQLQPDILFLDIQMPELSGIEVVTRLQKMRSPPTVVFTTAHDHYAVCAFELEAVDYLLKPFGARRFEAALTRARKVVESRDGAAQLERAQSILNGAASGEPANRIVVRDGNAFIPVSMSDIERVEAADDYAVIHALGRRHLVALTLSRLEQRLPNPPFLRVHRSHIVNFDRVDRLLVLDDSRLEIRMKDGAAVPVSRARSQQIRQLAR